MKLLSNSVCPFCKCPSSPKFKYPYATFYNNVCFRYIKCDDCGIVFVSPIPDDDTFKKMYAKASYHDCYYQDKQCNEYFLSVKLLRQYLSEGSSVLDYGCGFGEFLTELKKAGFVPLGIEFDKDAANFATQKAGCEVLSVEDFQSHPANMMFDAIHFGDVLEHLPDPAKTLKLLLTYLKPDGILYVEGPLEINPSPVYWATRLFGMFKLLFHPTFFAQHPPNHLFFAGGSQQLAFFSNVEPRLFLKYWSIYESGWPYAKGGIIKSAIARFAVHLGGQRFFGITFGNRFHALFTLSGEQVNYDKANSEQ